MSEPERRFVVHVPSDGSLPQVRDTWIDEIICIASPDNTEMIVAALNFAVAMAQLKKQGGLER